MDAFARKKLVVASTSLALALLVPGLKVAAAPNGPAGANGARQATYNSPIDADRPNSSVRKSSEAMPMVAAGSDSKDSTADPAAHRGTPATPSSGPAVLSMFGSLAVVIGLFLGLVWLLRRGSPKSVRLLSSDVVEQLGRSPLAGRQQMHVIRFGNRLLLVAVSPDGAETLAEISEPAEVDRLAGLCQQAQANSATQAFRQIFGQLADLRRPGRLDDAAIAFDGPTDNSTDASSSGRVHAASAAGLREATVSRHVEDDDV